MTNSSSRKFVGVDVAHKHGILSCMSCSAPVCVVWQFKLKSAVLLEHDAKKNLPNIGEAKNHTYATGAAHAIVFVKLVPWCHVPFKGVCPVVRSCVKILTTFALNFLFEISGISVPTPSFIGLVLRFGRKSIIQISLGRHQSTDVFLRRLF